MYNSPRTIARRWDVSEQTVYRWISSGRLPCTRPGGRLIRVSDADLHQFMAASGLA